MRYFLRLFWYCCGLLPTWRSAVSDGSKRGSVRVPSRATKILITAFVTVLVLSAVTASQDSGSSSHIVNPKLLLDHDIIVKEGESITTDERPDEPLLDTRLHPKRLLWLLAPVAFDEAADQYDIHETTIGVRHGVGVEANTWLVGNYPTKRALEKRDALTMGIMVSPSILFWTLRQKPYSYAFMSIPILQGIFHIKGGNEWRTLMGK